MIKFFRKIRQKLLSENKFSKYLLYAIGEIILVVIGILIALQVNNWNENNKKREFEITILKEIRNNLIFDLEDFESNITHLENKTTSSASLLKAFEDDLDYNDSLGYFFFYLKTYPHFNYKSNGYKLLLSKGLDIIKNDTIRNRITDLYEARYKYLKTWESERIVYNNALESKVSPYYGTQVLMLEHIPADLIIKGSVETLLKFQFFRNIRNYEILKKDFELHGIIKHIETMSKMLSAIHTSVKNDNLEVINMIEKELEIIS
ncbi:DUF6090 family protein [Flagellimonas sp. GZD32]|uniref:DUF6090 family protein n=1 Tax=Flagellimonas cixiensis TaxID=3228750 RepID=UPI0035C88623